MAEAAEGASVTALVPRDQPTATTLFGSTDPDEVVGRATKHAKALAKVIESRELFTKISGRNHVRVEGWTLLGSMIGVYAVPVWTHPVPEDWRDRGLDRPDGWQARVEARTLAGQLVGAATASCMRTERNWAERDEYALESMAQTRATGKALRLPLGFVIVLAGYDATPAEEMPVDHGQQQPTSQAKRQPVKADPEVEAKKQLIDQIKAKTGGTLKGVHDAYRAAYNLEPKTAVKSSDLTVEVLTHVLGLVEQASGDSEIVEGEIVEDGSPYP